MTIVEQVRKIYEGQLLSETGKVYPPERLREAYELFQARFGPESLKHLTGEVLLETLFNHGNRDSLVYLVGIQE